MSLCEEDSMSNLPAIRRPFTIQPHPAQSQQCVLQLSAEFGLACAQQRQLLIDVAAKRRHRQLLSLLSVLAALLSQSTFDSF